MAQRRALVIAAGRVQELPAADSLQGVAQWSFGTGDPNDTVGVLGDYYVGSDNKVWSKGATTWTYTGVQYGSSAAVPEKTVPVDADILSLGDSANGLQMRKLTWASAKAALLAYLNGQFREKLSAARTYYVRTDGSDSNTGLANTASGAFRTVQRAVDSTASLDLSLFDVTVRCTGEFTENVILKPLITGGGRAIIRGDVDNLSGFVLNPAIGACVDTGIGFTGSYHLAYVKFGGTGGGITGLGGGGILTYESVDFGQMSAPHIVVPQGVFIRATGPYQISGGGHCHVSAYDAGQARIQNITVTLVGNPVFEYAFAISDRTGSLLITGATFSGGAVGKRFEASRGGGILTFAGNDYLPGNAPGTATSPGWYA